jgi:hypothetical protein
MGLRPLIPSPRRSPSPLLPLPIVGEGRGEGDVKREDFHPVGFGRLELLARSLDQGGLSLVKTAPVPYNETRYTILMIEKYWRMNR